MNGWKLVPLVPTEEMVSAVTDLGRIDPEDVQCIWDGMLAAAPVPPAGDVEVLASLGLTLAVLREAFSVSDSAERLGNMDVPRVMRGAFGDFERVKAEVTRLTAERDGFKADIRVMTAARNALRSQVNDLLFSQSSLNEDANELQSELTKARELLTERSALHQLAIRLLNQSKANLNHAGKLAKDIRKLLDTDHKLNRIAHQSAPAAKGGE